MQPLQTDTSASLHSALLNTLTWAASYFIKDVGALVGRDAVALATRTTASEHCWLGRATRSVDTVAAD